MTDSIRARIQKLMERALHPSTPPAEAEACMAKADVLMAQHMIDRESINTFEQKSRVTSDTWDVDIYGAGVEFYQHVYSLLYQVLSHCNLRSAPAKGYKAYTVVGYPEDIAYAERMWFRIFKEFVTRINPVWDSSLEVGENVHIHMQAGFKWPQIWSRAYKAGQHPIDPNSGQGEGRRLGRAYRKWLADNGIDWNKHTQTHGAYRNSYAASFRSTISQRLREMREKTEAAVGRDKFLPAVQSTKADVDREFYLLFPHLDPENIRRENERQERAEAEAWAKLTPVERARIRAERAKQQAREEREARAYHNRTRSTATTYDEAGWRRGKAAAEAVNLRDDKAAGEKKKEIDE